MFWLAIPLLVVALQAPEGLCQAAFLGLDLNLPSYDIPPGYQGAERTKSMRLALSIGWFSKSLLEGDGNERVGLVIRRRELTTQAATLDPLDLHFQATTFQFNYDRRLFLNRWLLLTGGAGLGVTILTKEWENGEVNPDVWSLPGTAWHLSPEIRAVYPADFPWTVFAGARGTVYLSGKESTFPFKSGMVFSVGVQLNINAMKTREP